MPRLPQEIRGPLLRDYENPLVSLNKAGVFSGRLFLGGGSFGGVPLGSHDFWFVKHTPLDSSTSNHETWA